MVNVITAAYQPLLYCMMKFIVGITPHPLEIEPGTLINMWLPGTPNAIIKRIKPVVVLLHGFAVGGIITWKFQVGALLKKYAVYVPDLLFFGGSTMEKGDRSMRFQAKWVVKGLRMVGVEKCTVVGFSYGGFVAVAVYRQVLNHAGNKYYNVYDSQENLFTQRR